MYRYSYILHLQSYLEDVYAKLNAFDGTYNSSYRCDKGLPWIPREKMLLQRPVKERTVSRSTLSLPMLRLLLSKAQGRNEL